MPSCWFDKLSRKDFRYCYLQIKHQTRPLLYRFANCTLTDFSNAEVDETLTSIFEVLGVGLFHFIKSKRETFYAVELYRILAHNYFVVAESQFPDICNNWNMKTEGFEELHFKLVQNSADKDKFYIRAISNIAQVNYDVSFPGKETWITHLVDVTIIMIHNLLITLEIPFRLRKECEMVIRKEQESALGRPASQPDGNMELNTQEGVPTQSASSSEPPRSIPAQILNPLQILAIQILSTFPIRGLIINLEDPQNMADTDGEPVENATSSN